MSFSPVLAIYRAANFVLGALGGVYLASRARRGKEDPARIAERFGRYSQKRSSGPLVWLHAASVGESGVALALIEALAGRDTGLSFLLTTGTRTSADLVARRAPARTTHVYVPLDRADCVRRFLDFWRPDLGVFLESELWPNLILESEARGVKLALVNARMSPSSLRRWGSWSAAGTRLLRAFSFVSAADQRTALALTGLQGADVRAAGNLKLAAPAPRVDQAMLTAFIEQIDGRPVWLAASTHAGEDEIVLDAHALLRAEFGDALLIIAPRHPERGDDIEKLTGDVPRRSRQQPVGGASVYLADTLGEMGALYALAPVAFVGGSLSPHLKGHNPIEPAKLGAAIITGPHVESFEDVFAALFAAGGARTAKDAPALAAAVALLWRDEAARQNQLGAARAIAAQGAEAFEETVAQLSAMAPAQAEIAHASA